MTTKVRTTPENEKKILDFANKIEQLFFNLYERWQDEKEHEDINDYGARLAKELPEGWAIVKMSKSPFGIKFTIGTDAEYMIYATSKAYGWKRTK